MALGITADSKIRFELPLGEVGSYEFENNSTQFPFYAEVEGSNVSIGSYNIVREGSKAYVVITFNSTVVNYDNLVNLSFNTFASIDTARSGVVKTPTTSYSITARVTNYTTLPEYTSMSNAQKSGYLFPEDRKVEYRNVL